MICKIFSIYLGVVGTHKLHTIMGDDVVADPSESYIYKAEILSVRPSVCHANNSPGTADINTSTA